MNHELPMDEMITIGEVQRNDFVLCNMKKHLPINPGIFRF